MVTVLAAVEAGPAPTPLLATGDTGVIAMFAKIRRRLRIAYAQGRLNEG